MQIQWDLLLAIVIGIILGLYYSGICLFGLVNWRPSAMYFVCGVNDASFRDALVYALNQLNLPFEETIWRIQLLSLNADLRIGMAAWRGIVLVNLKQRQHNQR